MDKLAQGLFIGLVVIFNILIGAVSNEFNVEQSTNLCGSSTLGQPCFDVPSEPSDTNIFDKVLAPFKYVWNAASQFFAIITWQVDSISPFVAILLLIPNGIAAWMIVSLIRGI